MMIFTCNLPTCYSHCLFLFISQYSTFCSLLVMCHHFYTKLQKLIHNYYRNNLKTMYASSLQLNLSIIESGNHKSSYKSRFFCDCLCFYGKIALYLRDMMSSFTIDKVYRQIAIRFNQANILLP